MFKKPCHVICDCAWEATISSTLSMMSSKGGFIFIINRRLINRTRESFTVLFNHSNIKKQFAHPMNGDGSWPVVKYVPFFSHCVKRRVVFSRLISFVHEARTLHFVHLCNFVHFELIVLFAKFWLKMKWRLQPRTSQTSAATSSSLGDELDPAEVCEKFGIFFFMRDVFWGHLSLAIHLNTILCHKGIQLLCLLMKFKS